MSGHIVNEIFAPSYHSMRGHKIDLVMLNFTVVFKDALCKAEMRGWEDSKGATTSKVKAWTLSLAR